MKSTFALLGEAPCISHSQGTPDVLAPTDSVISPLARLPCRRRVPWTNDTLTVCSAFRSAITCQTWNLQAQKNMEKSNRLLRDARGCFGCMDSALAYAVWSTHIASLEKKLLLLNASGWKRKLGLSLVSLGRNWYEFYLELHLKCWFESPGRGSIEHRTTHKRIWLPAHKLTH